MLRGFSLETRHFHAVLWSALFNKSIQEHDHCLLRKSLDVCLWRARPKASMLHPSGLKATHYQLTNAGWHWHSLSLCLSAATTRDKRNVRNHPRSTVRALFFFVPISFCGNCGDHVLHWASHPEQWLQSDSKLTWMSSISQDGFTIRSWCVFVST